MMEVCFDHSPSIGNQMSQASTERDRIVMMIDFSCKHDILIRDEDGTLRPMDEPYFESKKVADGTWRILSDGDYSYLVEGEIEAAVIDSGYGCGNLREYCQTLTDKPVKNIFNTHDHFDHTANNSYFECAYMSQKTSELATMPFPSFEGIDFPRDYKKQIIEDGFVYDLGGRTLEAFYIPDHAVGSMAYLDRRNRILFSGDELSGHFKLINTSVENVYHQFLKLEEQRKDFDLICCGPEGAISADALEIFLEALKALLDGAQGEKGVDFGGPMGKPKGQTEENRTIFDRHHARPCDMKLNEDAKRGEEHKRTFHYKEILIVYDETKVRDEAEKYIEA